MCTESDSKPTMLFAAFISHANRSHTSLPENENHSFAFVVLPKKKRKGTKRHFKCFIQSDHFASEDLEYASQLIWIHSTFFSFKSC